MRRDAQRDELRIGGSLGEGLRHVTRMRIA
jgi:hypothetical protein